MVKGAEITNIQSFSPTFLTIEPLEVHDDEFRKELQLKLIDHTLRSLAASRMDLDLQEENGFEHIKEKFTTKLPVIVAIKGQPGMVTLYALSHYRPDLFKFILELSTGWLVPGKRLHVSRAASTSFRLPQLGDSTYVLNEVAVHVDNEHDAAQLDLNLPVIEAELQIGIASSHHARRILEIRGLSINEFNGVIQDDIAALIDRYPEEFDLDVLTEMQHVLLTCREDFKASRESRYLSRLIATQYLFRKELKDAVKGAPDKRHIKIKLFRTRIKQEDGEVKAALGILVGVNFLKDKEFFDKMHLLKAIQSYLPLANPVQNSYFSNRRGSEPISTLYLEIEKSDWLPFTDKEIKLLRAKLPVNLKERIKHLLNPVFMPRNEEEIIRNILSLSSQIKYLRDIPQVFITFDEQTSTCLLFTVILVRVLRPDTPSVHEMFKRSETILKYIHDRCQHVGILRRKYKKEATVFRVKMSKDPFIRADHTIDLNRARQVVVSELYDIIGDIRDYNGGMISRQNEVLGELKSSLAGIVKVNELLLENFFYSLTPVIMRSVLELEPLNKLFRMLVAAMDDGFFVGEHYALKLSQDDKFVYVMIKADDRSVKDDLQKAIGKLQLHSSQLAYTLVPAYDEIYLGYLYRSDDVEKQKIFSDTVQKAILRWESKKTASLIGRKTLLQQGTKRT